MGCTLSISDVDAPLHYLRHFLEASHMSIGLQRPYEKGNPSFDRIEWDSGCRLNGQCPRANTRLAESGCVQLASTVCYICRPRPLLLQMTLSTRRASRLHGRLFTAVPITASQLLSPHPTHLGAVLPTGHAFR